MMTIDLTEALKVDSTFNRGSFAKVMDIECSLVITSVTLHKLHAASASPDILAAALQVRETSIFKMVNVPTRMRKLNKVSAK
jgi:wyosine [tRNA(Phe)-imidazoG37] synthetase (radical SAM superfamily)